jgi:hypothetical protein
MKQPPIVQEILQVEDIDALLERVRDVGVACAMARLGDANPRELLQHLLDLAESYQGDLVSTAYTHHGASHANRYIESD